jgi:hypothetical protein
MAFKDTNIFAYLVTLLVGMILGTGGIWQYYNLELSKDKLKLDRDKFLIDKQNDSINVRTKLNETIKEIINLNSQYKKYAKNETNYDAERNDYSIKYHLLADNYDSLKHYLALLDEGGIDNSSLPQPVLGIAPSSPTNVRIVGPEVISYEIEDKYAIIFLLSYSLSLILLTIFIPKLFKKISLFINSKIFIKNSNKISNTDTDNIPKVDKHKSFDLDLTQSSSDSIQSELNTM